MLLPALLTMSHRTARVTHAYCPRNSDAMREGGFTQSVKIFFRKNRMDMDPKVGAVAAGGGEGAPGLRSEVVAAAHTKSVESVATRGAGRPRERCGGRVGSSGEPPLLHLVESDLKRSSALSLSWLPPRWFRTSPILFHSIYLFCWPVTASFVRSCPFTVFSWAKSFWCPPVSALGPAILIRL